MLLFDFFPSKFQYLWEEHLIIWPAKCSVSSDALCHIISESFLNVKVNGDPSWPGENQLTDPSPTLGFWENNLPGAESRTLLCTLFSVRLSCLVSSQQKEHGKQPHAIKEKVNTLASVPIEFIAGWLLVKRPNGFVKTFTSVSYPLQTGCEETLTFKECLKTNYY